MMFADTTASIVGKRYGKHRISIPYIGSKRTIEGSIAFFVTAIICSFPVFFIIGQVIPGFSTVLTTIQVIILTLVISGISTLLELFSPSKYDDLIIPLGASILTTIIAFLIGI